MKTIVLSLLLFSTLTFAETYDCVIKGSKTKVVAWKSDDWKKDCKDIPGKGYSCKMSVTIAKDAAIPGHGYLNDDTITFVSDDDEVTLDWDFDSQKGTLVREEKKDAVECKYDYGQS